MENGDSCVELRQFLTKTDFTARTVHTEIPAHPSLLRNSNYFIKLV